MRTLIDRSVRRVICVGAPFLLCCIVLVILALSERRSGNNAWADNFQSTLRLLVVLFWVYAFVEWRRLKAKLPPGACMFCGYSLNGIASHTAVGAQRANAEGKPESHAVGTLCPECGQHQPLEYPNGYPTKRR